MNAKNQARFLEFYTSLQEGIESYSRKNPQKVQEYQKKLEEIRATYQNLEKLAKFCEKIEKETKEITDEMTYNRVIGRMTGFNIIDFPRFCLVRRKAKKEARKAAVRDIFPNQEDYKDFYQTLLKTQKSYLEKYKEIAEEIIASECQGFFQKLLAKLLVTYPIAFSIKNKDRELRKLEKYVKKIYEK